MSCFGSPPRGPKRVQEMPKRPQDASRSTPRAPQSEKGDNKEPKRVQRPSPNQDFWRDPSWNIVENFFIDRTAFGGGTTTVSEAVFDNLTPVTRDIPNTEFNTTETNWTGQVDTTSTVVGPGNGINWWTAFNSFFAPTSTVTTETESGTETTRNFITQEEEFTSSNNFNIRETSD